jgi:hypothetical protein
MRTSARQCSRRRAGRAVAAAVAGVVLLAGCSGGGGSDDDAASSSSTSTPASETAAADLASALLPAEAFGPDARVAPVPLEQLRAGAGLAALGEDLTVTPESCAAAVQGTQPDLDAFDDVAGVSATSASTVTVEVLLQGEATENAIGLFSGAAQRCPQAQLTSPEFGQATVTFEELPVPDLGDGSAGLGYTITIPTPGGTPTAFAVLLGAVQDGDRLVVLTSLPVPTGPAGGGGELDPAAFTQLLQRAYEVQADVLG